jgi:O-antigen/teichoic acid export membrane protein
VSTTAPDAPAKVAGSAGLPSIARGGALNLVGAGISAVAGLLLVVLVTRALPRSDAGVFFALTSVFLLAEMVARLGTGTGLVYFIARLRAVGRTDRIRAFQRVALTPVVLLALLTSAALVAWSGDVARLLGGPVGPTRTAVVVLALLLPVTTLSDTLLAATRGHATMVPTVALDRIGRPLLQLGLVAVAVTGSSTALLAGAWALPWAVSAALAWWWLLRLGQQLHAGRHSVAAHPPVGEGDAPAPWREFWTFTWPRAINSLAQLALQRLDIVLVTVLIGPAQGAVYTAATRFLVVGQLTGTAIATAAQPRLAEQLAVGDRAGAKAVYQAATAWIVLLNWPLYLLCAVFADVVLAVFGDGYDAGRPVVLVLAGAMLFATACGMVDMLLNMAGRTSWTLANSVVALVVMVSVDLVLIPRLGILGAGIGWAAAIVANNALPLTQLVVSMGLHPFGRATVRASALSAACFGVLPGGAALLLPGNALAAGAAVLVGGALFLVVALRRRAALGLPTLRSLRPARRAVPDPDVPHARHAAPDPGGTR